MLRIITRTLLRVFNQKLKENQIEEYTIAKPIGHFLFRKSVSSSKFAIMKSKATIKDDGSCSSCDSDFAFYGLDFSAVDFENGKDVPTSTNTADDVKMPYGRHPETSLEIDEVNVSETIKAIQYLKFPDSIKSDLSCQKVRISAEMDTVVHDLVRAVPSGMDEEAKLAVDEEEYILLRDCYITEGCNRYDVKSGVDSIDRIRELAKMLSSGQYIEILDGVATRELLSYDPGQQNNHSVAQRIRQCVHTYCTSVPKCIEAEMIAVAALNLFMQCNYTGPSLHHGGCFRPGIEKKTIDESLLHVNPHKIFAEHLKVTEKSPTPIQNNSTCEEEPPVDPSFHNAVLGELSIAGEWPCSVSKYPYFLLFSRSILSSLSSPNRPDWTYVIEDLSDEIVLRKNSNSAPYVSPPEYFVSHVQNVSCAHLWCSRAIVAHNRLFLGDESPQSLWEEAKWTFEERVLKDCNIEKLKNKSDASLPTKTLLEYGLAEHHFDKNKKGKDYFNRAVEFCDLDVEITGSEGRRTKYQKRAVAQYLVRAKPTTELHLGPDIENEIKNNRVTDQEVKLNEDSILLDKVKYVVEKDNVHHVLSVLQLTVLLALCLDVKNDNPMDGLTAEQMGAFLERVLQQHDDWMVYATGLLERAWLESERNHTKERAILQLQALADQHSNRLTLTQSTFKSAVEDSAPPQERLRHIHYIVYPPRWYVLKDLAERYARLGIVTSAAEIFQEIEMWDEVVECYRRAGKGKKAEEVVRKRLEENETPRMWAALGDITNEPSCYEKALVVSNGKFSDAHVALGKYYHEKGDLQSAVDHFRKAVQIKPLSPHIWFRLGTISMLLHDWQTALQSFTEVVQQEPEEGDAWANVAAIHIHNRNPEEAYPALNEVRLKDFQMRVNTI